MNPGDELDNLYARLKGIRQFRGVMTSQTRKDVNRIIERLCDLRVLTDSEGVSLRVNEFEGMEAAEFSGIPERAAQLMAVLEHRNSSALLVWAMQKEIVLAIIFSDITNSVVLSQQMGNVKWQEVLQKHFVRARNLADETGGFFVKDIGDGLMALFHDAASALDFAIELREHPVDSQIAIHQGAHIGKVIVNQKDAVGTNVDLANRVANKAQRGEIVVTEEFRNDVQRIKSPVRIQLPWQRLSNITLEGFKDTFVLWRI